MDIYDQFLSIPCAMSDAIYAAVSLSTRRKDFLVKGVDGAPIFLLHDASEAKYSPGVQFRHLTAQFHSTCRVHTDDTDIQDQFALVACDGAKTDMHELFVRCFSAAIEELPVDSGTRELNASIQKLLDLFRALAQPSGREVSGLWAELYVIAKCGNVSAALKAWHDDPFDRFDFSWGNGCLEVKSTIHAARLHEFALEQLAQPTNGVGYVASLLLQPLTGGLGVLDLAHSIEEAMQHSPALREKLWNNIARALGSDFSEKLDKRFDVSYVERRLLVYAMSDVPKPDQPVDKRVTSIWFSVDLTTVESTLKKSSFSALREIFPV